MRPILFLLLFSLAHAQTYKNPQGPIYSGNYSKITSSNPTEIRVVTYNINFSKRLEEVYQTLTTNPRLKNADVIFLQEAVGMPGGPSNTAAILASWLNMNYVFIPAQIHPDLKKDYGCAILSPWPLSELKKMILPGRHFRLRTQRAAVGAQIKIGNSDLNVYSVHLENMFLDTFSSDEKSRELQVLTILSQVPTDTPAIIGGDFNAINPSGIIYLLGWFWLDGYSRASSLLPTENKIPIGIDHIFSRGKKLLNYGTVYDFSGSDHAPVWADFQL